METIVLYWLRAHNKGAFKNYAITQSETDQTKLLALGERWLRGKKNQYMKRIKIYKCKSRIRLQVSLNYMKKKAQTSLLIQF